MVSVLPIKYCVEPELLPEDEPDPPEEDPPPIVPDPEPSLTVSPPGNVIVAPLVENIILPLKSVR